MNTFKDIAYQILQEAGKPLHSSEITKIALGKGWLNTAGKTPESTMNASLITDINKLGEKSRFIKTGPSTFAKNPNIYLEVSDTVQVSDEISVERRKAINAALSSRQKGDITEARVAELVALYGETALSCYRPISDDEGIDLVVKQKGNLKTLYIQVKSRWQDTTGALIVDVKKRSLLNNYAMGLVICMFDIEAGDIWDYVWFIPAPDFLRLATPKTDESVLRFISGKNTGREGKWDDYLIDKRDLADAMLAQMKKL